MRDGFFCDTIGHPETQATNSTVVGMTLSSILLTYISLSTAASSLITRERCNLRNGGR